MKVLLFSVIVMLIFLFSDIFSQKAYQCVFKLNAVFRSLWMILANHVLGLNIILFDVYDETAVDEAAV